MKKMKKKKNIYKPWNQFWILGDERLLIVPVYLQTPMIYNISCSGTVGSVRKYLSNHFYSDYCVEKFIFERKKKFEITRYSRFGIKSRFIISCTFFFFFSVAYDYYGRYESNTMRECLDDNIFDTKKSY